MINEIFSPYTASISDLKKQPMAVMNATHGAPLAILNHNQPVFYCVPRKLYEKMLDCIDDTYLVQLVQERENDDAFEVNIDDL